MGSRSEAIPAAAGDQGRAGRRATHVRVRPAYCCEADIMRMTAPAAKGAAIEVPVSSAQQQEDSGEPASRVESIVHGEAGGCATRDSASACGVRAGSGHAGEAGAPRATPRALTPVEVFGLRVLWGARVDVGADDADARGHNIDKVNARVAEVDELRDVCRVVSHRARDQHAGHLGPKHGRP